MDTAGKRIYAVRLALGDGWKKPMTMADFGALLTKRCKGAVTYDSAKIARLESGERRASIDDVAVIASVDPEKRGREWLAWGMVVESGADFPAEKPAAKKRSR